MRPQEGTVPRVSPITELDFRSERALRSEVARAIPALFAEGWVDPSKIHHQSARFRQRISQARESIAQSLQVPQESLIFVGELGFAFDLALTGLLRDCVGDLAHSEVDRQIIHAQLEAHSLTELSGEKLILPSLPSGALDLTRMDLLRNNLDFLALQGTNRETGVQNNLKEISQIPHFQRSRIFLDLTADIRTGEELGRWDVAIWDGRNFGGPTGLSILSIPDKSRWINPHPFLSPARSFNSFSPPLLIATALAMEYWRNDRDEEREKIQLLHEYFQSTLNQRLALMPMAVHLAGVGAQKDPRFIALAIPGAIAEEILRALEQESILIDAGSACGSGPISPSHVLDSLGFQGFAHLRIRLKPEHDREAIDKLIDSLTVAIEKSLQ